MIDDMSTWHNLNQMYLKTLSKQVKHIYFRHASVLYSKEMRERYGVEEQDMRNAKSFEAALLAYEIKVSGRKSLEDYHEEASCVNYLENIKTPLVVVTCADDPLVSQRHVQKYFRSYACKYEPSFTS